MVSIKLNSVTKLFHELTAIHNVSLVIDRGEFVFLSGKSGAGKSTLLNLITKQIEPTTGEIWVENENILVLPLKKIPYFRRRFGIVKQDIVLLENKTVFDNVALAMQAIEQPIQLIRESVPSALGIVGIRNKAECLPNELSGGEKFRVALARAIVNNPHTLVLDEPTANLDPDTAWDIMYLLNEINHRGVTVLMATHAQELVNIMQKRVVTLNCGEVIKDIKKEKYGPLI